MRLIQPSKAKSCHSTLSLYTLNQAFLHQNKLPLTTVLNLQKMTCIISYLSKQRSTLSDMRRSMQSCSRAINCMSLSSPWPMLSHSRSVSGSTSAIWNHKNRKKNFNKLFRKWDRYKKVGRAGGKGCDKRKSASKI